MSRTNDSLFHKEFRDMMNGRKSMSISFDISKLPLPKIPTMSIGVPKKRVALVRGIKEPFFDRLNGEEVQLVGRTTLKKRQVLSDGSFRKNPDGSFFVIDVPVKHGSVAIVSSRSIGLKRIVDG